MPSPEERAKANEIADRYGLGVEVDNYTVTIFNPNAVNGSTIGTDQETIKGIRDELQQLFPDHHIVVLLAENPGRS